MVFTSFTLLCPLCRIWSHLPEAYLGYVLVCLLSFRRLLISHTCISEGTIELRIKRLVTSPDLSFSFGAPLPIPPKL